VRLAALAFAAGGLWLAAASTRIVVTVVEPKTGKPVQGLAADDFSVFEDKTQKRVEKAEFVAPAVDVMLLVDTSLAGPAAAPLAGNLIAQLGPKEQMAIVAFHSSADLIQDFTSSRELLLRAIAGVKFGNIPRVLDALYAALDSGFGTSGFRRVILLLTAGLEGDSRVRERDVVRLARRNGVSIFPVYVGGRERAMFDLLARQTGGASFNLRDLQKATGKEAAAQPGPAIFEVLRGHYVLNVPGNLALGEKVRIEVKRQEKLFVSALPE
jgi:hypothetical protein